MSPTIVSTRAELRDALCDARPGLVPTMGALHEGHLALIRRAARENAHSVVSIFVNPTQFGDRSDLERYPRDLARDATLAAGAGATLIFAPPIAETYPPGYDTWVDVGALSRRWEGASRPDHFRGVATVVTILLNLVRPARAYFGEKDYQQLQVIRRLHADLRLPGIIVGSETVRDADGLALSSRNARLSPAARRKALTIPHAIDAVVQAAAGGERDIERLKAIGRSILCVPGVTIDYLAVVDSTTLEPMPYLDRPGRLLVAVEIGGVRLIDNAAIMAPEDESDRPRDVKDGGHAIGD